MTRQLSQEFGNVRDNISEYEDHSLSSLYLSTDSYSTNSNNTDTSSYYPSTQGSYSDTETVIDELDDHGCNNADEPARKKLKLDEENSKENSVDESEQCPICLEAWTNSGTHRLCSLQCGHLFGYTCIMQWLQNKPRSLMICPTCKRITNPSFIRILYANKVSVVDKSKEEELRKKLEQAENLALEAFKLAEQEKRKRKENEEKLKLKLKAMTKLQHDFGFL